MNITELNREIGKEIPAHYRPLIEQGQIDSVLRLEINNNSSTTVKDAVNAAYRHCAGSAGDLSRYLDPAEEFYGRGSLDSDSHLIYLFPCVAHRDYLRLESELVYRLKSACGDAVEFDVRKY